MKKPLSIYVHIPFCEKKCPYCDFLSRTDASDADKAAYIDGLCAEITAARAPSHIIQTIYFGGGTPSYIDAAHIARVLAAIRGAFDVSRDAEISIECNPNSVTREKLLSYRKSGVNRISIGIQSFSNKTLKTLERVHNAKQARTAIKASCEIFDNVSIDLIHSIRSRKPKLPRKYLKLVTHVSVYGLTMDDEPQVSDKKSIREQTKIERILAKNGLLKYEVSNFARAGAQSRHNLVYWRCGEWLGFGEGAKSHFQKPWTDDDRIMLGLRLVEGIDLKLLDGKKREVARLIAGGFFESTDGNVFCTQRGFFVLNQILARLL